MKSVHRLADGILSRPDLARRPAPSPQYVSHGPPAMFVADDRMFLELPRTARSSGVYARIAMDACTPYWAAARGVYSGGSG